MFIENNNNFLDIPITSFSKFIVRNVYSETNVSSVILRLENFYLPVQIDNNMIQISNDGIVIHNIVYPFILKHRLEFLLYLYKNGIDDIYDTEKFLEPGEKIVYTNDWKDVYMTQYLDVKSKNFLIIGTIICIVFILLVIQYKLEILSSFIYIFITFIIGKHSAIINYFKNKYKPAGRNINATKTYNYHLRYVITDKRVLFFDFNLTLLYAFKFDELEFVNISNYDATTDVGDIYLSNIYYSNYVQRLNSGVSFHI